MLAEFYAINLLKFGKFIKILVHFLELFDKNLAPKTRILGQISGTSPSISSGNPEKIRNSISKWRTFAWKISFFSISHSRWRRRGGRWRGSGSRRHGRRNSAHLHRETANRAQRNGNSRSDEIQGENRFERRSPSSLISL